MKEFVRTVRNRTLHTSSLQLMFLQLREILKSGEFWELGSSVAHARRDQGHFWKEAISIWATNQYYENLDPRDVRIDQLPLDIFLAISKLVKNLDEKQLSDLLRNVFPHGITKREVFQTLHYLYAEPKKKGKLREKEAFVYLIDPKGVSLEDKRLVANLVVEARSIALNLGPVSIAESISDMEQHLAEFGVLEEPFTDADREFLQLHWLVANHCTIIDIKPGAFKKVTGRELGPIQPMLFVSCMEDEISLDLGFFEDDGGVMEPMFLEKYDYPFEHVKACYRPVYISSLNADHFVRETDKETRLTLYNHPIRVMKSKGRHYIVVGDRHRAQFS